MITATPRPKRVMEIHTAVLEAETYALRQRHHGLRYLRMNKKKAGNPADVAMCERLMASKEDPGEFENLISFPEVNALFTRGALYFSRGR